MSMDQLLKSFPGLLSAYFSCLNLDALGWALSISRGFVFFERALGMYYVVFVELVRLLVDYSPYLSGKCLGREA
jgi:hypothetical protein